MTTIWWLGLAAVAVGLAIGAGAMAVGRRTAATREQAVRRQRIIQYVILAVLAAFLIFDVITTPGTRYLNIAILAFIPVALAFDWFRARRRRTMS
ncbi:hypothetical protein [Mycobacterium branderi]|uniref:Uncharacterized protein n=1 Tax=Mycobacterium branderi TaxID=43348 RepID=A0A7I7WCK7_9MYCO|nr:hypothetical protein [Mycobacterium branderi]MCV7232262.1 hypothetical protein [Mycobacterium branderi]ORA36154.1 hypothetical protein BST20_16500 [Mycobacterium branderi]BBZ14281.1 hypothetical protein MBRA_44760 [Mycobacterium branderi]